jgi:hypothetical protein
VAFGDTDGDLGALWVGADGGARRLYWNRLGSSPTAVPPLRAIPKEYLLAQNYPNPFNPVTSITFSIPRNEFVSLTVNDLLGREVRTVVAHHLDAGTHEVSFDARGLSSGVYFYRLRTANYHGVRKLVVLR